MGGKEESNRLTSDAHNNAASGLELVYVHDTFKPKLFEVEPVRLIKVCGDSLGVVVDHDRLIAHVPKLPRAGDGTPVEFDATPNTVDAATQDHGAIVVKLDVMLRGVVCGVQVVGVCRELGGESVDTLDEGCDSERFPASTNFVLGRSNEVSDMRVRKSHLFGSMHELFVNVFQSTGGLESETGLYDVVNLVQEPLKLHVSQMIERLDSAWTRLVDLGQLVNLINRIVLVVHRVGDDKQTHVSRL